MKARPVEIVSKTVVLTPQLWGEVERVLKVFDTDFAKFARAAIREKLARMGEQIAQAAVAK